MKRSSSARRRHRITRWWQNARHLSERLVAISKALQTMNSSRPCLHPADTFLTWSAFCTSANQTDLVDTLEKSKVLYIDELFTCAPNCRVGLDRITLHWSRSLSTHDDKVVGRVQPSATSFFFRWERSRPSSFFYVVVASLLLLIANTCNRIWRRTPATDGHFLWPGTFICQRSTDVEKEKKKT